MNLKELINLIQKRPGVFVEEERLDYVYYLVCGHLGCNLKNKMNYKEDLNFSSFFPRWLLIWVRDHVDKNYEVRNLVWYHIIEDVTNTDNEALALFFKLCDEFFQLDEEELQSIIDAADELDDEDNEVF